MNIRLYEAETGRVINNFQGHTSDIFFLAFTPDGQEIISASGTGVTRPAGDETIRIWDAASGEPKHILVGHDGGVFSAAISPDGTKVVTGTYDDGHGCLWDAATGQTLKIFTGHTGEVTCVTFLADETKIMTDSADNTARIWDIQTAQLLRILAGHSYGANSIACTPDGTQVVTTDSVAWGAAEGPAYLWDISDLFPKLTLENIAGKRLLRWPGGTLQQRAPAEPTWIDVPTATNPFPLDFTAPSR